MKTQEKAKAARYSRVESFKLSNDDAAALLSLVEQGDMGSTKSEVVRHLIRTSTAQPKMEKAVSVANAKFRSSKKNSQPKSELFETVSMIQCDFARMNNLLCQIAKSLEACRQTNNILDIELLARMLSIIETKICYFRDDYVSKIEKLSKN